MKKLINIGVKKPQLKPLIKQPKIQQNKQNGNQFMHAIQDLIKMMTINIQVFKDTFNNKNKTQNKDHHQHQQNDEIQILQKRFKCIYSRIPDYISQNINSSQRKRQIITWCGQMLKKVLSISFECYQNKQIDENKLKSYCSQNIIRNIIRFSRKHKLIKQDIKHIDVALEKQLLPFFLKKYPESQQQFKNTKFQKLLIQRDQINENQYNYINKSNISFDYNESGNYNQQIMQFLNELTSLIYDQKSEEINRTTLKKQFFETIQHIFTMIENEQKVSRMLQYDPKSENNNNNQNQKINNNQPKKLKVQSEINTKLNNKKQNIKKQEDSGQSKKIQDNIKIQEKNTKKLHLYHKVKNTIISFDPQKQKYKQKVKSYTHYLIGQKLNENKQIFSNYQVSSGNLKLSSSSLMRIITKWCEQLQKVFDYKQILNRVSPFYMKNMQESYIQKSKLQYLNYLLQQQHKKIQEFIKQVVSNNYQHQQQQMKKDIHPDLLMFSEQQAMMAQFSCFIFKNNKTYLISYLNKLIHGIKRAQKNYEDYVYYCSSNQDPLNDYSHERTIKLVEQKLKNQSNLNKQMPSVPQLLTFTIGDLLRCKCSSKQNQIIAIYRQIERISRNNPQIFRIIRVKNRLDKGNKDILINLLFKNKVIVEMQLAIKQQNTKFIEYSNKFNHYLYELKRAKFGPITEMCSVWMSQDSRSEFFNQKIHEIQHKNRQSINLGKLSKCCLKNKKQFRLLPFVCDACQFHYSENQTDNKHNYCSTCKKYTCFICQFQRAQTVNDKLKLVPNLKKNQYFDNQGLQFVKQTPNIGGLIMNVNSKQQNFVSFYSIQREQKIYLFQYQNQELKLISEQKHQKFSEQFVRQNIVCTSENIRSQLQCQNKKIALLLNEKQQITKKLQKLGSSFIYKQQITKLHKNLLIINEHLQKLTKKYENFVKQTNKYFIQKYMKKVHQSQKQSISIVDCNLTLQQLQGSKPKIWPDIKKLNFSQNENIKQIQVIVQKFPNVQLAVLNKTGIQKLPQHIFTQVSRLFLNKNRLTSIDSITKCKNLIQLDISHNQINSFPQNFQNLTNMNRLIANNNCIKNKKYLQNLPNSLQYLDLQRNIELDSLPSSFGNIISLQHLNLGQNNIQSLPESFGKLKNLKYLSLYKNNNLQNLPNSFGALVSLQYLNLNQCNLLSLPKSIENLKLLHKLQLSANHKLVLLPQQFGNLQSLQILHLNNNTSLQSIPQSFCNLKSLQYLYVIGNQKITNLPQSFGLLSALKHLYLCENANLKALPQSFGMLLQLKYLNISWNQSITCLPQTFGNLNKLQYLIIANNYHLVKLPQKFGKLSSLKHLQFSKNGYDFTEFPQSLCDLSSLQSLVVRGRLSKFPQNFDCLNSLKYLQLSCNSNLRRLPQKFGLLSALQTIDLSCTQLQQLPQNFGKLAFLKLLHLNNTKIKCLPQSFGELCSLQTLNLYQNINLTHLCNSFGNLNLLKHLDLSFNTCLSQLPQNFMNLKCLQFLNLNNNESLQNLPINFGHLKNLCTLIMNKVKIAQLPQSFGCLSHLQQLQMSNNTNLSALPASFNNLKSLRTLKLAYNNKLVMDSQIFTNFIVSGYDKIKKQLNLKYIQVDRKNYNDSVVELGQLGCYVKTV